MTRKKKKILLIIGCAFLCLVVLREFGILDVNLHKSLFSTSQFVIKRYENAGEKTKHFSYSVTVKHQNEIVFTHTQIHDNLPPIEVEVIINKPVYQGNFFMPLIKDFKMSYLGEYKTTDSPNGYGLNGEIKGDVTAKILGLCSRKKAKDLAFNEAKKQIESYFQSQFNQ